MSDCKPVIRLVMLERQTMQLKTATKTNLIMICWKSNLESCSLCHKQLVNKSAIVSNFVCFGPTAMFHQSNCLCVSQIKNSWWIKLRCILIKIDRTLKKSIARFWQFTATTCRTAHNVPSPKGPNDRFFSLQSSMLSTKHNVGTRGTKWNAAQRNTECATSQKSAVLISTCDRNHLSGQFVSKRRWITGKIVHLSISSLVQHLTAGQVNPSSCHLWSWHDCRMSRLQVAHLDHWHPWQMWERNSLWSQKERPTKQIKTNSNSCWCLPSLWTQSSHRMHILADTFAHSRIWRTSCPLNESTKPKHWNVS